MERFSCYDNLPPKEYTYLLQVIALNRREKIKGLFMPFVEQLKTKEWTFILTGSDGKEERHPQSITEIILLYKNSDLNIGPQITIFLDQLGEDIILDEERKVSDSSLSFYKGILEKQFCYPDRILDAAFLLGDPNLFIEAKRQVLQEMIDNPKVKEAMKDQLRTYRQTLERGIYRGQVVFDERQQYYYESNNFSETRMGFKMGPIRAVQRALDLLILESIKNNDLSIEEVASNCPSNTCERIEFLMKKGLIDSNLGDRLIKAYSWFLREYHRIQEMYKESDRKSIISYPFNLNDFNRHKKTILDLLNLHPKLAKSKSDKR